MAKANFQELRPFLNRLYDRYHAASYLESDPLEIVHRYRDPWDQEAVALIAATLAYGNVTQIRRSVEDALARLQRVAASPGLAVRSLGTPIGVAQARRELSGFVHRFNQGGDLLSLLRLLERSWRVHGSLGSHFSSLIGDRDQSIENALNRLIREWRAWEKSGRYGSRESFGYLLTAPEDGSCCKRWCMFLRWMGRTDALDLGLWAEKGRLAHTMRNGRFLRPEMLVIPLDTHTGRISQYLELTQRKTLGWKAALEVTEALRACDPGDPVRYDFAISRLGILDLCQKRFRVEICRDCELLSVCKFARGRLADARRA